VDGYDIDRIHSSSSAVIEMKGIMNTNTSKGTDTRTGGMLPFKQLHDQLNKDSIWQRIMSVPVKQLFEGDKYRY
jgi:hypothetical protein